MAGKLTLTPEQREIGKKIDPEARKILDTVIKSRLEKAKGLIEGYYSEAQKYKKLQEQTEGEATVADWAMYVGISRKKWEMMVAVCNTVSDREFKGYVTRSTNAGRPIPEKVLEMVAVIRTDAGRRAVVDDWLTYTEEAPNGRQRSMSMDQLLDRIQEARQEHGELAEADEPPETPRTENTVEKLFKGIRKAMEKLNTQVAAASELDFAGFMDGDTQEAVEAARLRALTLSDALQAFIQRLPDTAIASTTESPEVEPEVSESPAVVETPAGSPKSASKAKKAKKAAAAAAEPLPAELPAAPPIAATSQPLSDMDDDSLNSLLAGEPVPGVVAPSGGDIFSDFDLPSVSSEVATAMATKSSKSSKSKTGPAKYRKS